jgi:hypothetical protein
MIWKIIPFAPLLLLSACAPMPIQQEPGLRGQVMDIISHKPIPNARVCMHEPKGRCVFSDAEGKFDLKPIFKDRWQFILIEPLGIPEGKFTVEADGYAKQTISAGYRATILVDSTPLR